MRAKLLNRARLLRCAIVPLLALPLAGCDWVVLNPSGDVARQQGDLVIIATLLMLLIVVPVMAAIGVFAWRYRAGNTQARYEPEWSHSTQLELMIWAAPLLIIIALGAVTWVGTHLLDPYRSLSRVDAQTPLAANAKPVNVEVVSLDWKWLFIYPEQNIATVNELVVPANRPLRFRLTSSTVMNAFYVPELAGMIYTMPGMETKLHAVFNKEGTFKGISSHYSGAGFSQMHFVTRSVSDQDFNAWVASVKADKSATTLDRAAYLQLDKPSVAEPVRHYATVSPTLFDAVVDLCVQPGRICQSQMAMIDAKGGVSKEAARLNVAALTYDKSGRAGATTILPGSVVAQTDRFVKAYCSDNRPMSAPSGETAAPKTLDHLRGAGVSLANPQLQPAS